MSDLSGVSILNIKRDLLKVLLHYRDMVEFLKLVANRDMIY